MNWAEILFTLLFTIPGNVLTRRCSRYPSNTFTPKSPVDENFVISITGNPQTYILNQSYNVSLQAYNGHRFVSAKLVLENENGEKSYHEEMGHLEVVDSVETRYSQQCVNMIESTNANPKTRLDLVWVAPANPGNGCVLIRATVLQHRDVWFMDDGGLTKRVCEEVVDDVMSQKRDVKEMPCCACDEARYELTFEALWSRNLHPKDFPTRGWLTRFTDILGAAHTSDYRFWDKDVLASPEMQVFAEHGSSKGLEREFKQYFKEGKIRTIIKSRGPAFPYLNSPSVASVRVDYLRHQLSVASKIIPSPDWIVGVTGLELCLPNCTWLEEKVINLYPWDVGTDAGPSYTSPDQPQLPTDVIRRMNSEYPPDHRSPFFDERGAPMKPLATLAVRRQRLYERKCEDEESNNSDDILRECFTHPWSGWSECTAECGEGKQYRNRVYKQLDVAKIYDCDVMVNRRQERPCQGKKCTGFSYALDQWPNIENEGVMYNSEMLQMPMQSSENKAECSLGNWSTWLPCNVTCGDGMMERSREYIYPHNERACQNAHFKKLKELKKCQGSYCLGHTGNNNDDYTDDHLDLDRNAPQYYTDFGLVQKPYKYLDRPAEFQNQKHLVNDHSIYDNRKRPKMFEEHFEEHVNKNEDEFKPQYKFDTDDLIKEIDEENSIRNFDDSCNKHQGYKSRGSDLQQNYASHAQRYFTAPPKYCHQPLSVIDGCVDKRVVGNFWFYNYCTDECMLFTTDSCDNNRNKFVSLHQCEVHCATPMRNMERFLRQTQQQGCQGADYNESNSKGKKVFNVKGLYQN